MNNENKHEMYWNITLERKGSSQQTLIQAGLNTIFNSMQIF